MLTLDQKYAILKRIVDIDDPIVRSQQLVTSGLASIALNQDSFYQYDRSQKNLVRVDYAHEILMGFSVENYDRILEIKSSIKNYMSTGAELRKTLELFKQGTPIEELNTKPVSASIMILTNILLQQTMSDSDELSELVNRVFKRDLTTRALMYPLDNICLLICNTDVNNLDQLEQAHLIANMSRAIISSMQAPDYKHDKIGTLCDQITLIIPTDVEWWNAVKYQIRTLRDIIDIDLTNPESVLPLTSSVSATASTYSLPDLNV